jgi:hypothetical protein
MKRPTVAVAVVALVVLAGCGSPLSGGTPAPESTTNAPTNGTTGPGNGTSEMVDSRPDPESDTIGWEQGVWYNENISVTMDDGLNATERNLTIARSMARVEHIRGIEFEEPVPVEVISRETYQEKYVSSGSPSESLRTFDNTKFEALFLVGEDRDSLEVQESNRGSNVLGFYTPRDDRIVIVSDTAQPTIEETTLGHELMHALQFRNFEANFSSPTRDKANAHDGLIEGEASFLDNTYSERCGAAWSCLSPSSSGGGGGGDLHLGIYVMKYFPYSDGAAFVRHVYQQDGWEGVAAVYDDPPASSEQVALPEKYGTDPPLDPTLKDTSSDAWERVTIDGRAPYGEVGVGGITAMFAYPAYHEERQGYVLNPREFLNYGEDNEINSDDPFDYTSPPVDGWEGERMYVYENGEGDTAYTWRIAWESSSDAQEFASKYHDLLQYWGAEQVRDGVWRIPEGESQFADAFRVTVSGDTVTIVNAPTVDQLDDVHTST